ncbi:alpha/beta hydrolase [Paractinoplanes maris]|uniref:alpha/beta hydrolase n=1 Tax=Paractinoplanes maris TaxID=1734446 RepID=UPI0020228110|nr:alpha/beta hydrolase fold domain-containing protein [Actinoplanes maris]
MTVSTTERKIIGPHGEIPMRVYAPAAGERSIHPRRGLVWAHGGAFAGGDLDMPENDWVARQLAGRGVVVVTVDYRLSPLPDGESSGAPAVRRFPYPVASEEVTAAFVWATHSDSAVPAANWALGGASAGGNLAAGAALRLRDTGGPTPYALMLAYPVLHAALPPVPPELAARVRALPPPFNFSAEQVATMNLAYVQDPGALREAYAFPGGHDVSGLPPTFILNGDADSLRASGQQFGAELAAAGVDVMVIREPGTSHGHLNDPNDPAAPRSITRIADWLTRSALSGDSQPA